MGIIRPPSPRDWLRVAPAILFLSCPAPEAAEPSADSATVPAALTDQEVIRRFRDLWHGNKQRVFSNRFLGVPTLQNPLDVWVTQEIIFEVAPDFIVETGTFRGGSALLWATFLEQINPEGRVITIDIEDGRTEGAKNHPLAERRVEFMLANSVGPRTIERVAERVRGKKVLVILDSIHTREHILKELNGYGPLVSHGSYAIVQDTMFGGIGAVNEFLASHDDFHVDTSRERYILTNNRHGFLKRSR